MSNSALRMEGVYKKFHKGEVYNSLRDLLPALSGQIFREQSIRTIGKRDFWALQDISFDVKRGEAFGIIGPNGAGKSTILKILSRIMKPTKGQMIVSGRLSALIEVAAGFHQDLTGRENIYLNGTILGMSKQEIDSKIDQIIAFSGIEEFIDTPVKRYSSGMYARLGFSVASHVDPDILIVDEVLSVGDLIFQEKCFNHMRTIMNRGTTVIFVSHNLKATTELCQRAMLLSHGKVVEIGSTDCVVRRYLRDAQSATDNNINKSVYISKVVVRDENGERSMYETGQKVWADITITANERIDKVAVVLYLLDQNLYKLFTTSTERLGRKSISLNADESVCVTFELTLNIAYGTFYLCAAIHRYDLCKEYDARQPAATIFVGSSLAVCGAVNCFPKLIEHSRDQDHAYSFSLDSITL